MTLQHLRLLSTFQIIQGVLEGVMGLVFALSPGGTGTGNGSAAWWVGLSLAGLVVACNGLLRIVAGALNGSCRGRGLGIATVVVGLLSAVTCLCLPTSVALCVYGLLVYASKDVRQAFAMHAAGASIDEIARRQGTGSS